MKLCQSKESYIVHVEKEIHMDKMLLISIIGLISTMVWSTLKFTATCKVERQGQHKRGRIIKGIKGKA